VNKFTDMTGREWVIAITLGKVRNIENQTGCSLLKLQGDHSLESLAEDVGKFADALWIVVQGQHECSADEFFDSLSGESFDQAGQAFVEALIEFFPAKKKRVLQSLNNKGQELMDKATEEMLKKIDNLTLDGEPSSDLSE